jgi:predicted metalloendopeptidase
MYEVFKQDKGALEHILFILVLLSVSAAKSTDLSFNKLLCKLEDYFRHYCLILQVSPAGLGLPDRSYYYRPSDSTVRKQI